MDPKRASLRRQLPQVDDLRRFPGYNELNREVTKT